MRARLRLRAHRRPSGRSHDGRHTADADAARASTLRLRTDMAIGIEGGRARARHTLREGEVAYCSLSWAEELASPASDEEAQARMAATTRFWRTWVDGARLPDHQFREPIARSILAIKGLTYMPTGATVAAATTSLPETPGGERNWDYRYAWMRDATFTLQALHWLNLDWEAEEFMQFVADLEPNADGAMQIMYGIDGRRDLTESTRDDLSGYAGARPGADRQRRLRPAPERRLRRRARLHPAAHPPQPAAVAAAVADRRDARPSARSRVWREPDQGIWEARGAPRTTSRRSSCRWVAMDRAAKLADIRGDARQGAPLARGGRGDPRRHPRARRRRARRRCASTTRPTRSTPRTCWPPSSGSSRTTIRGCARPCWRSRTS